MVHLTVVSWNLNSWQTKATPEDQWSYLFDDLRADVALVQEATTPPANLTALGQFSIGGARTWGTGIVSSEIPLVELTAYRPVGSAKDAELTFTRPGTAAAATLAHDGQTLTVVSLYGLMERNSAYRSVNTHLADLSLLLDAPAHYQNMVIGGDLNLTTQWAGPDASYAPIDAAILQQFPAWGLRDLVAESTDQRLEGCPCSQGQECRHVQTWFPPDRSDARSQNDYMFASPRLGRGASLRVDDGAVTRGLSDHAPLVATLHL